ncbi:GPP34 family phosphoprotein [Dactylosporangium sp. CA-139066]|uniref:GPP34 family phosphoprotein n=1 Tax=Dactylosporangium sp. CA-139066 TaxID=3239930 RepID=UPI003D8F8EF3
MPPRLPLPAEYFLLAHDGYTGRPHIGAAVLGLGVAGALLAELAFTGDVRLDGDVASDVERLAPEAYTMIGDSLVGSGVVHRPPVGRLERLARARPRYVAADALAAAAPRILLRHAAEAAGPEADERTKTLAALAVITGLEPVVADAANRAALGRLRAMAAAVTGDARTVAEAVAAAAARIALTPRRGT